MRLSLFEIFLIQLIVYCGLWLLDDYIATFMTIVIPIIAAAILLISTISDLIEPSRISRKYYWIMLITIITPIAVGAVYMAFSGGSMSWMEGI